MLRKWFFVLCAAVLLLSVLSACAPGGKTTVTDGTTTDGTTDGTTAAEGAVWPAHLFPDWFPAPEFESIYYTEVTEHNVLLRVISTRDAYQRYTKALQDEYGFFMTLINYVALQDANFPLQTTHPYLQTDHNLALMCIGYDDRIEYPDDAHPDLPILKAIPTTTGFVFQMVLSDCTYDPNISRKWQTSDTDLGLDEIDFSVWPTPYLPAAFTEPDAALIEVVSMRQEKNGVHLVLRDKVSHSAAVVEYMFSVRATGYAQYVPFYLFYGTELLYANVQGDYFFYDTSLRDADGLQTTTIQVVRAENAHVLW